MEQQKMDQQPMDRQREMRVGLVGLGNMGARMAQRLIEAGFDLAVCDTRDEVLDQFEKLGARGFRLPAELASESDIVLTVLPDANVVQKVVLGQPSASGGVSGGGLIDGLRSNSVVVDMTSSLPDVTRAISRQLTERGVAMLDAPVTGGVSGAQAGTLTIMVGGDMTVLERVREPLEVLARVIVHVGPIGSGHTAKALNNLITATTLTVTAEAMALGVRMGLDPERLLEVINQGSARSASSEVKFPQQILSGRYDRGFTMALMAKDLGIALGMGQQAGLSMPVSSSVNELWKMGVSAGMGDRDHTAIAQLIEQTAGVSLRSDT